VDFSKLSREDLMVGGGGILLVIGLLFFAWYSVPSFDGVGGSISATSSPYSIWGVLALIVTIIIIADLALARYSPATTLPTTQLGRDMTRAAACGVVLLLLFIKFIAHVGSFGYGFFLDIIFAIVMASGAWLNAQGKVTRVGAGPTPPAT
jgi:hypothetical protein